MSRAVLRLLLLSGALVIGFAPMSTASDPLCTDLPCSYYASLCNKPLGVKYPPVSYCVDSNGVTHGVHQFVCTFPKPGGFSSGYCII
jgi:hypothetical protein